MTHYKSLKNKNLDLNFEDLKSAWEELTYEIQSAELPFEKFLEHVEQTGQLKQVDALKYFENVSQGKHISKMGEEIDKIIPPTVSDPIKRAQIAIAYIEEGNHVGKSDKQHMKDVINGKNQDDSLAYLLKRVINNESIDPCVVIATPEEMLSLWDTKMLLEGADKAIVSALVKQPLRVLEISID